MECYVHEGAAAGTNLLLIYNWIVDMKLIIDSVEMGSQVAEGKLLAHSQHREKRGTSVNRMQISAVKWALRRLKVKRLWRFMAFLLSSYPRAPATTSTRTWWLCFTLGLIFHMLITRQDLLARKQSALRLKRERSRTWLRKIPSTTTWWWNMNSWCTQTKHAFMQIIKNFFLSALSNFSIRNGTK